MTTTVLLDSYLKQLRLPLFAQHYRKLANEAAQTQLAYEAFLLALAEQEVTQREKNQQLRQSHLYQYLNDHCLHRLLCEKLQSFRLLNLFEILRLPKLSQSPRCRWSRYAYVLCQLY